MAIVVKRGNYLHIQWFDPVLKKTFSKSSKLKATQANQVKAEKYAKKLQDELSKRHIESRQLGVKKLTLKDAFAHFLHINKDKHPKTIKDYERFYKLFSSCFDADQPCIFINKMLVEDWLLDVKSLKLSQNSIHAFGKQCNHFLNFLFEYNYTPMFKINRSVKTKPEVKEKIIFKDEHIRKIFENLGSKNSNFKAAIYILFYTGLRSSDILNMTAERVDLNEGLLSYYSPKRKKYRIVPFHENLRHILSQRLLDVGTGALLNYGSVENIGRAVSRYLTEIGLSGMGYTARTFRKTFITQCRSRFNMDASVVRELVGHEQGNTTDRYYNQINTKVMKKELRKFKFNF
jgi:integrase